MCYESGILFYFLSMILIRFLSISSAIGKFLIARSGSITSGAMGSGSCGFNRDSWELFRLSITGRASDWAATGDGGILRGGTGFYFGVSAFEARAESLSVLFLSRWSDGCWFIICSWRIIYVLPSNASSSLLLMILWLDRLLAVPVYWVEFIGRFS